LDVECRVKVDDDDMTSCLVGLRGNAFGWNSVLQDGRSGVRFLMGSLGFFIDLILLA